MSIVLYGIPNCDTVKKARVWLQEHSVEFHFHDFKKAGLANAQVENWLAQEAWDVLVNRKGTTWRALSDERKAACTSASTALALMLENPSLVKRPVLERDGKVLAVGFSAEKYQSLFE
ncbi:MAG: ArsC family reductase [Burkholderiales bacterium]|nr:ArsC family reductase [Burkholderiales bacterium]